MVGAIGCTQEETLDDATRLARLEAQGRDTTGDPEPVSGTTSALIGTTPSRTRTIAGMMFDIGTGPPNMTTLTNLITGSGTSQRHMFVEISFGLQDLHADFFGPYTLPVMNCLTIACCGPSSDRTGNGATVAMEIAALAHDVRPLLLALRHAVAAGFDRAAPGATRVGRASPRSTPTTRSTTSSASRRSWATTSA